VPPSPQSRALPFNPTWNWVQFVCVSVFAGFIAFLHVDPPFDSLVAHLSKTLLIATACGSLAGRFGDSALKLVVTILWFL